MSKVRLQFAIDWPAPVILLLLAGAFLFVFLVYGKARRSVGGRLGWALVGLRLLGVVILFLLIFRPVLSFERTLKDRPRLLFVVDTSGSMSIRDFSNQPDRLTRVVERLRDLAGEYGGEFDDRYVAFDATARPLEGVGDLSGLKPDGKATALARGVSAALSGQPRERVAALFLLTDGIDNSAEDPVQSLVGAGVPITAVGVGSRLRQEGSFRDIVIEDVQNPPRVTVNNVVAVDAFVEGLGFPDRVVDVRLQQDDQVLATQRLVLDNKEGRQKVTLEFTPRQTGQFAYQALIAPDDSERIRENNSFSFTMTVTDPKIRVFYIEGTLRTEYRELRRVLETDPNVEVLSLIRVDENQFNQQGNIQGVTLTGFPREKKQMEMFDVFVIGDLDRTFFKDDQPLALCRDLVRAGKGLLMIGGYHSLGPGGYGGTPIEEALPVFLGSRDVGQEKEAFLPKVTEEGLTHPIFAGIKDFFPYRDQAPVHRPPDLLGCVVTAGAKPGAQVLAVHPTRRDAGGKWLTVVAVHTFGEGRAMVFTGDTTWRWSIEPRASKRPSPYDPFWGQTIRWLASKELKERGTKPGVEAQTDKTYYRPGEKVVFAGSVRAEEGRATNRAETKALVSLPNGKTSTLALPYRVGTTGEYGAEFDPPEPGDYKAIVTARNPETGVTYGETTLRFQVGRPNLEFDRLDIDEALLRRIARETGGRYVGLYDLAAEIQNLRHARHVQTIQGRFAFAGEPRVPWIFSAFILLITVEWILRKRYQLS